MTCKICGGTDHEGYARAGRSAGEECVYSLADQLRTLRETVEAMKTAGHTKPPLAAVARVLADGWSPLAVVGKTLRGNNWVCAVSVTGQDCMRPAVYRLDEKRTDLVDGACEEHAEQAGVFVHVADGPAVEWRVGRKLGRTLYRNDVCVGMVDDPVLAQAVVAAMNAAPSPVTATDAGDGPPVAGMRERAMAFLGDDHGQHENNVTELTALLTDVANSARAEALPVGAADLIAEWRGVRADYQDVIVQALPIYVDGFIAARLLRALAAEGGK